MVAALLVARRAGAGRPRGARAVTRGGFLKLGLAEAGTLVVGGATLYELVSSRASCPGKQTLDVITGACDVPQPPLHFAHARAVVTPRRSATRTRGTARSGTRSRIRPLGTQTW